MQRIAQNESTAARRYVWFTCVKDDDVNDFLAASDMSTFTVKISKNGAAAATPSGSTCTELDATNAKGVFRLGLDAADVDTLGPLLITITNAGGSKIMRKRVILVHVVATDSIYVTPPVDVTKWNGTAVATPTTAGVPRVDVKAMEAGVLTATAIAADAITASKIADGAIDLATLSADVLLGAFGILDAGTAQAGSTATTLVLRSSASAVNDAYVGALVFTKGGTGALQVNQISAYDGTTKVATLSGSWATTPDATTTYAIVPAAAPGGSAPSASVVAAAVWSAISEDATSYGDCFRGMFSVLACLVSGFDTGTLNFKSKNGSKTRIIAVDDDDVGRISVSFVDLTP